jgi:hypothetical protein
VDVPGVVENFPRISLAILSIVSVLSGIYVAASGRHLPLRMTNRDWGSRYLRFVGGFSVLLGIVGLLTALDHSDNLAYYLLFFAVVLCALILAFVEIRRIQATSKRGRGL